MLDDVSQSDFQKLTKGVYDVLEDRGIEISSRSLRKLKSLLHMAARKVLDKNGVLADKLSREIVAKEHLESRKAKELMSGIRQLAIQLVNRPSSKEYYLDIQGNPEIYLPLERKLGERPENNSFITKAEQAQLALGRHHLSAMGEYDVSVRQGGIKFLGEALRLREMKNPIVVTDNMVASFHLDAVLNSLQAAGFDVLYMDEDKARLGVMLADVELIGIPHRIVVGDRGLQEGQVEYRHRRATDNEMLPLADLVAELQKRSN